MFNNGIMSLLNNTVKGSRITQDARKDWMKIDGVALGESQKFGYVSTTSKDIGGLLDKMFRDPKVVAVVYNWKSGQAFVKTGVDINDPSDSKINTDYTTFIVHSRVQIQPEQTQKQETTNSGFLQVNGENFSLDGKKFIITGGNAYWLGYTEEHTYPTKPQIEEMFIAISRLGGNTIRAHTLGHSSGTSGSLRPNSNKLNEDAWDSIDYSFSMARKYNIKIIAPLTDSYSWYNGNYGDFCKTRGVPKQDFWTNLEVRSDFKDYIKNYLNHYNKYNKCCIKDDTTLGVLELGNELGNIRENADSLTIPTFEWLKDISEYIKSIDKNHLILNPADECLGQSGEFGISTIDCFGAHFYWNDYNRLDNGVNMTKNSGKPYIVGEYSSLSDEKWYRDLESRKVKGSLFWSMYPHTNGIFGGNKIEHNDGYTIHYEKENEKHLLLIAQHFCRLNGIPEVTSLDFGKYVPNMEITPDNNNWTSGKQYNKGDITKFNGKTYTCVRNHKANEDCVPELNTWENMVTQPNNPVKLPLSMWENNKKYNTGDLVTFNGKTYSCLQNHVSNEGWVPESTLLVLWNITDKSVSQPSIPVNQPSIPVNQPQIFGGRLNRLLNGKSPIGTYYQSWSAQWANSGENHDLSKITDPVNIVYLSFCKADCGYIKGSNSFENTGLQFSSDFNIIKKAIELLKKRGVVVMLSVGGASYPFTTYYPKNVSDLCVDLGCNGIDIDWEDEHGFERFGTIISSTRQALPDGCISAAGFSVGAYGKDNFVNSPPASSRTGMNIQGLKSDGNKLDWINIMSYDASPVFDPVTSFKAYRTFYKGPLLIGEEIPPEAWGGNVITLEKVKEHSEYVRSQGSENGIFTWSYQKQGEPNSKQILDTVYSILKNKEQKQEIKPEIPVVPTPKQNGKTILAPYCYSWSKWHRQSYKIPTLVDGIKNIGMTSATFAFVTSDGGNNLSPTVQENIDDMVEYVKLGGNLIISCGGAMSPWIEATQSVERMVELLGDLLTKTGSRAIDLDIEGTALHNVADYTKLNKAVAKVQQNFSGLYVSYTIPVNDPKWGESIEAPALAMLKNAINSGVNISVVNMMLMDLYGDYSKRSRWGNLAIEISENAKKTLTTLFPSRTEAQIYRTIGLCPMIGIQDDLSVFDVEDSKILARYAKEKNVGLFTFWAMQRDQVGNIDLNLHSKVNKVDFEFYNSIKNILYM